MQHAKHMRFALWLGFLAVVAGLSYGLYTYGLGQGVGQIKARGEADLALAEDRLTARLRRYQELAVTLADHPSLHALLRGGSKTEAERFLRANVDRTAALGLYYVDRAGRELARAGQELPAEALDGPWTQRARLQGALGRGHAALGDARKRAFFYAAPDFGSDGRVDAALLVAVDLDEVEFGWRSSTPAVFFVDQAGEIFISNRSELVFGRLEPRALIFANGQSQKISSSEIGAHEIWQLDLGPYIPKRALHLIKDLPQIGLRAEALIDIAPAERLARLQAMMFAAVCIAFGAILFLVTERRRALLAANKQLEARVEARTEELRRAQADLVQAGKLSALGQMSAGISHELNQPLMAIQQFADNGVRFLERGKADVASDNLGRISALAARAARIIKNLRAFARNESEPMGRVDLGAVLATACELTEARLKGDGIGLSVTPEHGSIYVKAGEVRLGQVFVNLINNAADAMTGQSGDKRIDVRVHGGARPRVEVCDTGPGIADPEKIFEPFYSTKAVGSAEGMGLGLSISYGLIESFGGKISGRNAPDGGAIFTVELERWTDSQKEAAE